MLDSLPGFMPSNRIVVWLSVAAFCGWLTDCHDEPQVVRSNGAGGFADGGNGGSSAGGSSGAGGSEPVPDTPQLEFPSIQLPGADRTTDFAFVPGTTDELLVLTHPGQIFHYRLKAGGASIEEIGHTSIKEIFFDEGCGLLSLAFDPDFETNHFVYMSRCQEQTVSTIARYTFDTIEDLPASEVEILSVEQEVAEEDWHRFGSMGFEPDGQTMWALLGDLFLRPMGQDPTTKAGALLRFKPNREPGGSGYEPAEGNAFSDSDEGDPSIYAYGLRSPWRGTRDRFGRFWIGDVGLTTREEVNLASKAGQNFGWGSYEGPCESDCEGFTNPLTSYGRKSDEPYVIDDPKTEPATRRAVWVGEAYSSDQDRYYGLFDDAVMFGDFFTGWVRRLEVDKDGKLLSDRLVGHLTEVTSWKTGPDGYMYVLTLGGQLHRALQVVESQ